MNVDVFLLLCVSAPVSLSSTDMFTGIVQTTGKIAASPKYRLGVTAGLKSVKKGDSIAVEGVCLTVVSISGAKARRTVVFDVSEETLRKTTLGTFHAGQKVNLEPSMRIGDPLGGHIVLGHVEGTGKVVSKTPQGASVLYEFSAPSQLRKYLVPKGSVAVDGISLTVVDLRESSFTVAVIPFTETNTSLGEKKPGDPVNLETDILAKYVESLLRKDSEPDGGLFVKRTIDWSQIMGEGE